MSQQSNLLSILGYIVVAMIIRSHALISASPSLMIPTGFAKFCCSSTSNDGTNELEEWLDSNFTVLKSNSRIRIRTQSIKTCILFTKPQLSDAGSYWCRKVNTAEKTEVKLVISRDIGTKIAVQGSDVYLVCPLNIHNNTISWANNYSKHIDFTTESSYSKNKSDMVIHNATIEHKGDYTCYSEEDGIGYKTKVIIERPSQNQIVIVNVSEQVILDCTMPFLEYPVYNWSIPDTCSSCPYIHDKNAMTFTADITDSGVYVCEAGNEYERVLKTFAVNVTVYPSFIFTNQSVVVQEMIVLKNSDPFINCSVNYGTKYDSASWQLDNEPLWVNETTKYSQNTSGINIYNVTADDEGNYTCTVGQLKGFSLVKVKWPPELPSSEQNQTVLVNVSEQAVLNCTVSSSPDPVYNWSIPDTCSSCSHTSNDSVMIFTADITDSGEYVCEAGNEHGNVSRIFSVLVISKPLIDRNTDPYFRERNRDNSNVILTCGVYYAHPSPVIVWNIMTELSGVYQKLDKNSTGKYILHNNASIEVYYRFILESDHLVFMCSAANMYGSAENVFHLWNHDFFNQEQTLLLYVKVQNCQDITNDPDEVFTELRQWFDDVCECNGHNNMYNSELTCVDGTTASVSTSVHTDGHRTANMLIDLAKSELSKRRVKLPSGWVVCLSPDCEYTSSGLGIGVQDQSFIMYVNNMENCQAYINNSTNIIQGEIEGYLGSVCNCDFQLFAPTCLDSSTASITAMIKSDGNNTAQMMVDLIKENMQERHSSAMHLNSGWVLCLSADCEWEPVNNSTLKESNDSGSVPLIVGLVVGVPCALIVIVLCTIVVIWIAHKRSPKTPQIPRRSCDKKDSGHIYDELSLFTMLPPLAAKNATSSPKSDKVVFDTSRVQPPSYQSLAKPRYESCSAASMEKCNDYHIETDARSIKDEDCYFSKPHYECCSTSSMERCNAERDKNTVENYDQFSVPQYESCSASSIEKYSDYRSKNDARSIEEGDCQKMADKAKMEHEPYSKLVHHK